MTCLVEGAFSDSVSASWLSLAISGRYGVGSRFKLKHTRSIINAIHSGELNEAEYKSTPIFDLRVSCCCGSICHELLICSNSQSPFSSAHVIGIHAVVTFVLHNSQTWLQISWKLCMHKAVMLCYNTTCHSISEMAILKWLRYRQLYCPLKQATPWACVHSCSPQVHVHTQSLKAVSS